MSLVLVNEIKRKFVHLSSSIIPIAALVLDKSFVLIILSLITFVFVLLDYLRIKKNRFIVMYHNMLFKDITRSKELESFVGASYVFLSCLIVLLFFEIKIACTSLFIMSISDSLSAIVGKRFGAIKIYKKKTLEGTLAFLLSSLIIILMVPELNLFHAIIATLVATIVELYSVDVIDDNLSIPISFCLVMTLLRVF